MQMPVSPNSFWYYVSTKAGCDPVKTIYLCAPEKEAATLEGVREFALRSGWQQVAEQEGAVLVAPIACGGWAAEPTSLLKDLYNETRNDFQSRSGKAIWGRAGSLWCWETILYVVGYGEGAVFAGDFLVANPNFAAACALVGGLPDSFAEGEQCSDHWMVRKVSEDYCVKNKEIPVCLWLFDVQKAAAAKTMCYFANEKGQVRLVEEAFAEEAQRAQFIFEQEFSHVIRWKNDPDGTLTWVDSRAQFYADPSNIAYALEVDGVRYDYFVHLPKGKSREAVGGLPVVMNLHGRGEPAWMFAAKNGWDTLADQTGEFVVVTPDSPGNIWFSKRDGHVFGPIIRQLHEEYHIDTQRVYLAGFSNGAMMSRELAYTHPELFAGIAASNGPWFDTYSMQLVDASKPPKVISPEIQTDMDRFLREEWQMPCAFFYGDSDPAAKPDGDPAIELFLSANGCGNAPAQRYDATNYFSSEKGWQDRERFSTAAYRDHDNNTRVLVTVMKNMPHGAIHEESRLIWEFLKPFRRVQGAKQITSDGTERI
jgi:poly(3-hydroxybutyrate) depolymerase